MPPPAAHGLEHLGRRVPRRADGLHLGALELRLVEVDELRHPPHAELQEVAPLDVVVHEALRVQRLDALEHLLGLPRATGTVSGRGCEGVRAGCGVRGPSA